MRCEVPTPQSILDDYNRDVFDQIIPSTETYRTQMIAALWNVYQFRGIGNLDIDYWVDTMKGRFGVISAIYHVKYRAMDEWLTSVNGLNPIDMSEGATDYTMQTENEDNPDNPQGSTKYLSDRNTVTYNGKTYSGLSSETLGRFIEMIPSLDEQFADEFRRQFFWGI